MKHLYLLTTLILFLSFTACKKDKKQNPVPASTSFEVEYKIVPMDNNFAKITYTDEKGNPVVITDPALFAGGSKKIKVSSKPFTAMLSTEYVNNSVGSVYFDLVINVDGVFKKTVRSTVPAHTTGTSPSLEYKVE